MKDLHLALSGGSQSDGLLELLSAPEVQLQEARAGGHTPVRQSVFAQVSAKHCRGGAKRMAALEDTLTWHAMIPPKFARYPQVEELLWLGVQRAVKGERTAKDALQLMEKQVEEALE
jgi:ABC-type glycerol-3-phosphate transport system substrate-binding protein